MPQKPTYLSFSHTATDDNIFNLTTLDLWFREVDIFVYTNAATVGNLTGQEISMAANSVYTVRGPVAIKDFIFKNTNAGSNTKIVVAGTCLSDFEMQQLGLV